MICKFNSFIEFSHMYSRENNEAIPEVFPLGNATEIIELDPEDIIQRYSCRVILRQKLTTDEYCVVNSCAKYKNEF